MLSVQNLARMSVTERAVLHNLQVTPRQEIMGKSFAESLEDWEVGSRDTTLGLAFLYRGDPVGLTLFRRADRVASIHGLKIACPWQGRGWGHLAFGLAIVQLRVTWPEIETLRLSVDAENLAALAVYRAYGLTDSGPVHSGPNGPEHHMVLRFQ